MSSLMERQLENRAQKREGVKALPPRRHGGKIIMKGKRKSRVNELVAWKALKKDGKKVKKKRINAQESYLNRVRFRELGQW